MRTVKWHDIPGWFDFEPLYRRMVQRVTSPAVFVEVGCWLGRSTACLAHHVRQSRKPIAIIAVDTWQGSRERIHREKIAKLAQQGKTLLDVFRANMEACGVADLVQPMATTSVAAAACFSESSLDFVFLDADHHYEEVMADIEAWKHLIKPGGYLGGHDYPHPPVKRAVRNHFGKAAKAVPPRSWLVHLHEGVNRV